MSNADLEVPPLRSIGTEEDCAERIRAAIRRGIKAAEEGRVLTHEEAMRRLAPWLGTDLDRSYDVSLTREEILQALDDLPDPCTMEEILHTLYVREQVKQGMWSLDNEPTFTQEEVEQSLARWLTR